jgi:hypothetical protein
LSEGFNFEDGLLMALDILDNNRDPGEAREKILRILDSYREHRYKLQLERLKALVGIDQIH